MAANLLTATPIEAAIIIAATLADPRDLLRLAVALPRRFATKCIAAPAAHRNFEGGGAAAIEMWSIAEEVARRWIVTCTDQERGWVPRRGQESWLGLMWEVQSLRRGAAVLGRSHEHITLFEGGSRATKASGIFEYRAAASKAVMRAGRHYVQFAVVSGPHRSVCDIMLGVTAVEGGDDAYRVDGHCFYNTWGGSCFPGGLHWEGMQGTTQGDRIGMLLDLDQGSMTVYKNDERLGVMATGLSGEYCWAVLLCQEGDSARIEPAVAPITPTSEELA